MYLKFKIRPDILSCRQPDIRHKPKLTNILLDQATTEEDMEAYYLKRQRADDPMAKFL